jgi:hypothetical protein
MTCSGRLAGHCSCCRVNPGTDLLLRKPQRLVMGMGFDCRWPYRQAGEDREVGVLGAVLKAVH